MKSDAQLYRLFQANPNWVFELAQLPSVGPCRLQSFTFKATERRADGGIVPNDPHEPLTAVEFQEFANAVIYTRTVAKMIALQEEFAMQRDVQGVIFFRSKNLDPKTRPWNQIIHARVMRDEVTRIASAQPHHPLVAVLRPLIDDDANALWQAVPQCIQDIKRSKLKKSVKETLEEVFLSWLLQRFQEKSKQEIEAMMLRDLPDIEDTRCGKELIEIGEKRGFKKALTNAVLTVLESKQKRIPKSLKQRIEALDAEQLDELLAEALTWNSWSPLEAWLDEHAK